jgi:hypothetical protein
MERSERWTAERVGEPGCGVRVEAKLNADALAKAIEALER